VRFCRSVRSCGDCPFRCGDLTLVAVAGFEPTASSSRTTSSGRLHLTAALELLETAGQWVEAVGAAMGNAHPI